MQEEEFSALGLAAVGDDHSLAGITVGGRADSFHRLNDLIAAHDLAEDNVLAIEPRGISSADEELASIGVGSSIGHGKGASATVLSPEVLVLELVPVDGLATPAVAKSEVTALAHEVGDDPVEKRFPCNGEACPSGQCPSHRCTEP